MSTITYFCGEIRKLSVRFGRKKKQKKQTNKKQNKTKQKKTTKNKTKQKQTKQKNKTKKNKKKTLCMELCSDHESMPM